MTYYGLYKDANRLLDKSKISLGEYERMIEPLNDEVRKEGHWIRDGHHIRCDKCYSAMCYMDREGDVIPQNFCPNCGAKMERSE